MLQRDDLSPQADLYLEGSDQHRGWFQSSLLTSCAMNEKAPYKALLTHGFVVDGQGYKMSKSKGNVIAPQKIMDQYGADILRLWVATTDYSGELNISDEILKRVADSYRRIRNTLRFLCANLEDFDYKKNLVKPDEMLSLDRFAIYKVDELQSAILDHYEKFEFYLAVQKFVAFCSEELGSFHLDILKDMDAVSLHCPKNEETTDMFSDKEFNIMKHSSYLINCARGGIVNEKALYDALTSNKIRGAGLDVYDDEPSTSTNPLFSLDNILLSPHIAGVTQEATIRMSKQAVQNVLDVFDNKVDPEVIILSLIHI